MNNHTEEISDESVGIITFVALYLLLVWLLKWILYRNSEYYTELMNNEYCNELMNNLEIVEQRID